MAFADLEPDIEIMRAENDNFLSGLSDSQLTDLNRTAALSQIKYDIMTEQGIGEITTDLLDSIAETYEQIIVNALTFKQLQMYYFQNNTAVESITSERMYHYKEEYNRIRSRQFGRFIIDITDVDNLTRVMNLYIG